MKIIGVIPARFASTRLPGKPLKSIAGKPLLQWVIEGAQKSKKLTEVLVATDHSEIFELAMRCGAKAVMTDSALPSGSDRIFAAIQGRDVDFVVNIQGDEPLVQGEMIDSLVESMLQDSNVQMATLCADLDLNELENLNVVKLITDKNFNALYFSRFPIPHSRVKPTTESEIICYRHLGMYAYTAKFLKEFCSAPPALLEINESLEQLRALYLGAKIKVVKTNFESHGVDTLDDVMKIEKILNSRKGL